MYVLHQQASAVDIHYFRLPSDDSFLAILPSFILGNHFFPIVPILNVNQGPMPFTSQEAYN